MASFAEWVRARDANASDAPSSGPPAALRVAARLSEFEVDGATETSKQFNWLVDTLVREEAERASVRRFKFEADQKRALLARLLARYCCRAVVGAECTIARTDGGKPHAYPVPAAAAAAAPNFNFNVSHEGDYVVAATEPRALCGADVCSADHLCRAGPPTRDQLRNLADAFAADEWAAIDAIDDATLRFNAFKVLWSCKEAVVKARGDGIVFDLNRVSFLADDPPGNAPPLRHVAPMGYPFRSALVKFDGVPDRRWRVDVDVLDAAHVASVARGPVAAMKDKAGRFRSTMRDPARGAEDSGAYRSHKQRLGGVISSVDQFPSPDCWEYKKYRNDLRRIILGRGGLTPYTVRKEQKPTLVEDLKKAHHVHCRRVRQAASRIDSALSAGCESTRARNKQRNAREAAGPVAVLLTKLETARRDREAADKRRRDADRDIATMPLFGGLVGSGRKAPPKQPPKPRPDAGPPSSRASPVRPRSAQERHMLAYERRSDVILYGKVVHNPTVLPRRLRDTEKVQHKLEREMAAVHAARAAQVAS